MTFSPHIRTAGDGQSSPSMASILTEWKSSTVSVNSEKEEEQEEPTEQEHTFLDIPEGNEEEKTPQSLEDNDTIALVPMSGGETALGEQNPGKRKAFASQSVSVPGDKRPRALNFMRKQGRSDSSLPGRKTTTMSDKGGKVARRSIFEYVRQGSKLGVRESLASIEHRHQLTTHGSLFVSPDVQHIERLTAKQRKSSTAASKSFVNTCNYTRSSALHHCILQSGKSPNPCEHMACTGHDNTVSINWKG